MQHWKKWTQYGAACGFVLWAIACSGEAQTTGGTSGNAGGEGGKSSSSSSQSGNTSSSVASSGMASSSVAQGAGGFGGAPMAFVCDPPAEAGSLYENSAKSYDINDVDPVSMCKYRGKVLLIVNTAAS
jgi:hypothetical protein